jgi:hypothetical protein
MSESTRQAAVIFPEESNTEIRSILMGLGDEQEVEEEE